MDLKTAFSEEIVHFNCESETEKICSTIKATLMKDLKRRGLVLGISGGIDSSVTLALAVKAVGKEKVIALLMPECHSADETLGLSGRLADHFNVTKYHEDITGILEAVGFYRRYNSAVQSIIPEYDSTWKSKIVIPSVLESNRYSIFSIHAQSPDGAVIKKRLSLQAYLSIVAATNFKQRIRKMMEYYYADRFNYAVAGTPNRLEYDQGFFVKLGDGAADIKPIAHLYKTQVYKLAEYLHVPEEIRSRPPTTDTYSLAQGQDEFYFSLTYDKMDICLFAKNNNYKPDEVGKELNLTLDQVERVFKDIDNKRVTTRYLHYKPFLIDKVSEIEY